MIKTIILPQFAFSGRETPLVSLADNFLADCRSIAHYAPQFLDSLSLNNVKA